MTARVLFPVGKRRIQESFQAAFAAVYRPSEKLIGQPENGVAAASVIPAQAGIRFGFRAMFGEAKCCRDSAKIRACAGMTVFGHRQPENIATAFRLPCPSALGFGVFTQLVAVGRILESEKRPP